MKDDLNSIPQTVTNETRDVVQGERLPLLSPFASSLIGLFYQIKFIFHLLDSKKLLEDLRTEISQFEKDLPLSAINDTLKTLDQVHKDILTFTPQVEKVESIR